jgi:hypothetical protein
MLTLAGVELGACARKTMRWVRKHATFGAIGALFALAVQVTLSFGHVHLDGAGRPLAGVADAARLALKAPVALVDKPVLAANPAAPAKPHSNGAHGDFCAICVVTQLAGALMPATASALPLPGLLGDAPVRIDAERALAAAPFIPFQARGPPLS